MGLGGILNRVLHSLNAFVTTIDAWAVYNLVADPAVSYISPDRSLNGMLGFANPTVNANIAFQHGFDGTEVGIALIDSGVNGDADLNAQGLLGRIGLESRVVYNQSFVPGQATQNQYGHCTHVAGILAGHAALSGGTQYTHTFRGVAPNSKIVNLRILDANGKGSDSAVIGAIERAVALKSQYKMRKLRGVGTAGKALPGFGSPAAPS